jgi:fucose permease
VFVGIGALVGFGAGAIDAGINTYIASEHGEGLMQWLHASFGVGITLGPIIMTAGLSLFESWRWGYSVVGSAQILLALCFFATRSMWRRRSTDDDGQEKPRLIDFKTPLRESLRRPSTWLSMLLFFFYTGVEVTLGNWVYTLLTESRGIAPAVAGLWAGSYWGMFTVGRLLAGIYTRRIKSHTLMKISLLGAFAGSLLLWWNPSDVVSLAGVAVVGFAIAPIFPGLVSGTSARVSPSHAANTIGMQISAAGLGGTGLSALAGVLANRFSLEIIPVYLVTAIVVLFGLYTLSMWGKTSA